ncbi:MAG: hypothetical protein IJ735_06850 [Clostridia bacterium]|nr:hypothetical protein [Clostridia bacterium]
MNNFLITLKMEIRGQFGLNGVNGKKAIGGVILNLLFDAIIYAIFIIGTYFVSKMILRGSVPMQYEYLVVTTLAGMAVELCVSCGGLIKSLYYDVDNELLLRFPIDGMELFSAKAAFVFLKNVLLALLFTLPFYIYYGVFTAQHWGFYIAAVATALYSSILPFFLANLIAVPVMHVNNTVRNKFGLKLVLIIVLMVAAFSAYMLVLRGILEYYQTSESNVFFSEEVLLKIKSIASSLVPASWFANVLYRERLLLNIPLTVGVTLLIGAVSILLSKKSYYHTLLKSLEKGKETFTKRPPKTTKINSPFSAIFYNELRVIFRSFNYSFQYLAMAIAAPLMVYFCNDLAVAVGDSAVGGAIIPGLTLMVVLIFDTIIVSFASTTISRNGETFYLTKIFPVPYKTQIFAKFLLYIMVAGGSSLLSTLVTWAAFGGEKYGGYIGFVDVIAIFFISLLIIVAQTAVAILSDLRSPTFVVNGEGELTKVNKNVSNSMILGIVVAVLYGLVCMILTYLPIGGYSSGTRGLYLILAGVSLVIAAASVLTLFLTVDKKYQKIVP